MRCFISIELPKEILDYLYEFQNSLKKSLPAKIKWVAKKQIHITIKFLGEISESRAEDVKKILSNIAFKPLKTALSGIGVFPNINYVRVIWVGLKNSEKIIELQQKIDSELLTMFPQDQTFEAHITLGRVKFIKDKEKFKQIIKEAKIEEKEFEVKHFSLMKSELKREGPVYEQIQEF